MSPGQIAHALSRKLLGKRHTRIMMDYYREKLPRLKTPRTPAEWQKRTAKIRKDLLEKVYLLGHPPCINSAPPVVQWRGVIETG